MNVSGISGIRGIGGVEHTPGVGRVNTPQTELPVQDTVLPQGSVRLPGIGPYVVFLSEDGDRAEITRGLVKSAEAQEVCQTCENRRYVDRSDDASVSYQTPSKISPNMSAAAVAMHENEHVRNEQANAQRDGREIISQTVTLIYDSCPECGKHYVSGGTTKTTSVSKSDSDEGFTAEEISPNDGFTPNNISPDDEED